MKWKTKDGQFLEVSDMGTNHIENCIKMMDKLEGRYVGETDGIGKPLYCDYEYYCDTTIYKEMIKELVRRGSV